MRNSNFVLALSIVFLGSTQVRAEDIAIPEITFVGEAVSVADSQGSSTEILSGKNLDQKRATTLGETLSREPGVTSNSFGMGASRPVLRGLSGDRVRILENGTGVVDASTASADHTTAIDPMAIERIEIVRGAKSLIFGASIVGGVVNTITTRIPESRPETASGKAETRISSVDGGTTGGAAFDASYLDHWAVHADGSSRNARDYFAPAIGRVENSFNNSWDGAIGTSRIWSGGYAGGAFSKYGSNYGTIAEKNVAIKMNQERYDFSAGLKDLGWVQSVKFKNTYSNYRHGEVTGEQVGTTFRNRGNEARLEMEHAKVGDYSGVFGVQVGIFDFEALGDEAFLPATENGSYSAFIFEQAKYQNSEPSFSMRVDHARVNSKDSITFGPADSKNFTAASVAVAGSFAFDETNSVLVTVGHAERAPNYQELFANGAHVATRTFEVGNRNLDRERSESLEVSYRRKHGSAEMNFDIHAQNFNNFIALSPTGVTRPNAEGTALPEYRYLAKDAILYGAEFEMKHQFEDLLPQGVLETTFKIDIIRGVDKSTNRSLPRMTPMRESIGLKYKAAHYAVNFDFERVEKQNDVASGETTTDAYNLLHVMANVPFHYRGMLLEAFAKAQNVLDSDARNHVSILKNEAPLPGRNVTFGLQAVF